ncbi:P-loop containing nucleoside triphosphate hydrolase protein [Cerioporus squamosus]|nr:P-loop containing nucleoside triphosphate hydrolase protein [Cerioporus squamosus]
MDAASLVAAADPDPNSHAEDVAHSADLLDRARARAADKHAYKSEELRTEVRRALLEACGKEPYDWQLDVTEALLLGLDTAVIAGTGAGKTMPFVMPLLIDKTKKKKVIIISPLNELELDQARRFKKMGLTAAAVNGDVYNMKLHNDIVANSFQVILTSPEMCLKHELFSSLIRCPEFMRHVLYMVIDEAHCVAQWGESFRTGFSELVTMRSLLGGGRPFLLTSATLAPFMLTDVFAKLEFTSETTYTVNLGNDRPNITPIVHRTKAAQSSLHILEFLVRDVQPNSILPRVIVFFNTRDLAFQAYRYLQECAPDDVASPIDYLHAGRSRNARRRAMQRFRDGQINILCATEAAGMGMDIPDIDMSLQFMAASSLSVWIQRAGRAGRSGQHAFAILLVEPAIFQVKRPRAAPKAYKKKAEDGMRRWAGAETCRRAIADEYFGNPPRPARLVRWRIETWTEKYSYCAFSHLTLLPDKVLTSLATHARLQRISDVKRALPLWPFADAHGAEILRLLADIDLQVQRQKKVAEDAKVAKATEKKEKENEARRAKRQKQRDVWKVDTRWTGSSVTADSSVQQMSSVRWAPVMTGYSAS